MDEQQVEEDNFLQCVCGTKMSADMKNERAQGFCDNLNLMRFTDTWDCQLLTFLRS